MKHKCSGCSAVRIGGKMYEIGGTNGSSGLVSSSGAFSQVSLLDDAMSLDTTSPDIPNCKYGVVEMGKLAMFQ
eukprot:5304614-Ditylum_brightwellii.AAC.1